MSITEDNKRQLNSFKNNPPHPSYIAGFIDGDGCIFIRKILDGYQSGFSITQCRTNILQIIRYHFGGRITTSSNRNNKIINLMDTEKDDCYHKHNIRNQYNLIIQSNEYQILLEYLQNSFIIKENQYQNLNEFNKLVNLIDKKEEKEELYLKCSSLNKICNLNEIYLTRLNIEYISGLFDAEGCIYIDNKKYTKFYISITQKNHTQILYDIVKFLGFGTIDCEIKFKIYNKTNCLKFIHLVKNYLIVKYNQAVAFEKFLETDDIKIKEQMYLICNREKHEIEVFTDLNQNDNGKEGYLETLKLKSLKEQICKEICKKQVYKEICKKQVYKEKSEKMKGEGNHNYGKSFSEETKKKMSVSIREAKGGVSDETIIQVRKMINDGYKNVDIQNLMSLPRHIITRIKNFQIICRTEEKIDKNTLTQEQVNLSKRKIDADDIIIVIEKFIEKWKPTQILNYFIEQNKTNITIDIIKNIKRNLTNNKKIIYESELSQTRYEYYTTLIKQFTETLV
jgi:hypothetical protein